MANVWDAWKKYCIGSFLNAKGEETVELFSKSWILILGESDLYWPTETDFRKFDQLVASCASPEPDWTIERFERVLGSAGNFTVSFYCCQMI